MRPPRYTPKLQAHVEGEVYPDSLTPKIHNVQSAVFKNRFPSQVEQCLRLLTERLQAGLDKRNGAVLDNTTTWNMTALELSDLAKAVESIYNVYKDVGDPKIFATKETNEISNLNWEQL